MKRSSIKSRILKEKSNHYEELVHLNEFSALRSTIAIYEPAKDPAYRLILKNPEIPVDYKSILKNLGTILSTYFTWDDLVSEKIKEWAESALKVDLTDLNGEKAEKLWKKVESDASLLFHKVLISSMGRPLKVPILDEKHTWDKDELIEYCNTYKFAFSPFNGFRINVSAMKIHAFAMEILTWVGQLPFDVDVPPTHKNFSQSLIVIEGETGVPSREESERKKNESLKLAGIAEQQLHDFSIARNMKNATAQSKVSREEMEEYVQLEVERAAHNAEAKANEVREEIKISNELNDAKVKKISTNLQENEKQLREAYGKLSEAEKQNALNQARIDHLSALYTQKQQEIAAMRNQGGGGFCTIF